MKTIAERLKSTYKEYGQSLSIAILFFFLCIPLSLQAEEEGDYSLEQTLINSNEMIAEWFDSFAEGIDLFLAGKKSSDITNTTYVKLQNSTYSREGEKVSNTTNLSAALRLPNVERYWSLKFTTYDEREEARGIENGYLRQAPRETNYGATVGFLRTFGKIRTAFQPRIELSDPLKISHSLSFETIYPFVDFYFNPRVEFYAKASKGVGVFQAYNFHYTFNEDFSLTFINEADYEEKIHDLSVTNGFSVGQSISSANAMSYNLLFFSNNIDNYHLIGYTVSATWYHLLYKKILDFQLTPYLDFPTHTDYKGLAGLTLQVNVTF